MADLARASAWMALGTIVSRVTGFGRLLLLIWVIGTSVNADLFSTANTLPNSLYILVAGGVFNVVLVPQLVRTMKQDPDGGDAFAQRVITLGLVILGAATVILLVAVPLLLRLVFPSTLFDPQFAEQLADATLLLYVCLPQVFFYGAFVLVGQVLNARERFGPMMWAPIVNNAVACAVLLMYLAAFGASDGSDGFTRGEALLLGLGSTAGIAAQTAVLIPFLRRAGFRYRPRFDFRGVGLGHTMRLAAWTLGFIVVNQIAFVVVNRLATGGNLAGASRGEAGAGAAVYELGFLVSQVPHGVITVSLATAIVPTLAAAAADRAYDRLRLDLARTIRLCLVVLVPLAAAVASLGIPLGGALALGAAEGKHEIIGGTIAAFSLSLVMFSAHYLVLRGFYADEDTRTPFLIQFVIAALNVAFALVLVRDAAPSDVAMRLALAFGGAYTVGVLISTTVLSRRIGPLLDREMRSFLLRLLVAAAAAAAVMVPVATVIGAETPLRSLLAIVAGGVPGALLFLVAARVLGVKEIPYLVSTFARRR